MPAVILTLDKLYAFVPARTIKAYFNDSSVTDVTDALPAVQQVLMGAEGELFSRMRRGWAGDQAIIDLVNADETMMMHLCWVACELASERRPEFTDSEGKGAHMAQYNRAIAYFDNVSKGNQRSKGESAAGVSANVGGSSNPRPNTPEAQFVFAPSKQSPGGHGGF